MKTFRENEEAMKKPATQAETKPKMAPISEKTTETSETTKTAGTTETARKIESAGKIETVKIAEKAPKTGTTETAKESFSIGSIFQKLMNSKGKKNQGVVSFRSLDEEEYLSPKKEFVVALHKNDEERRRVSSENQQTKVEQTVDKKADTLSPFSKGTDTWRFDTKSEPSNLDSSSKWPYVPSIWKYKDKKLTIVLLENTIQVAQEQEIIEKIVRNLLTTTDYICIIHYGSMVMEEKIREATSFDYHDLLQKDDMGTKSCFWDALVVLERLVKENHEKKKELDWNYICFHKIEIIGIGRCYDNASSVSNQVGIEKFSEVAKLPNVISKYFCFREENFIEAAKIGFRSIGAVNRKNK